MPVENGGGGGGYVPTPPRPAPAPTTYHPSTYHAATAAPPATYSSRTVAIQKALGIPADGIYGPQTRNAVMAFQRSHGLAVDGIVGPATSAKMFGSGSGSSGSSGSASGGGSVSSSGTASGTPALDPTKLAAEYGWSMAVLNSNPELKAKFQQAVAGGWTTAEFIAQIQSTQWYQTQGEAMRQNLILQKADPATWNQRLNTKMADIVASARQYGATLTSDQAKSMASDAMMFGWDSQQVQQHLAGYVSYNANPKSPLAGQAGQDLLQYKKILGDYGVTVSDGTMQQWLRDSIAGTKDQNWVQNYAINSAKSAYPALSQRLDAGETVASIAEPYKQSYAKILETDANAVNLNDPLIKQALQGKDQQGNPQVQSLWQFENNLRQDPRWIKTQNAQDSVMSTARQVLNDFGFQR